MLIINRLLSTRAEGEKEHVVWVSQSREVVGPNWRVGELVVGDHLPPMAHPDNMFLLPFSSGRQLTINNQLLTITNDKCNVHITLHHIVPPLCGRETFGNYSGIFRKKGNYVKGDNYIRLFGAIIIILKSFIQYFSNR